MVLDILIVAVLLLFAVSGYQHGFAKSVLSLARFVLSVGIAYLCYSPLAKYFLESMTWPKTLEAWIVEAMNSGFASSSTAHSLAVTIVSAAAFAAIFASVCIAVTIIGYLVDAATKLPVIKEVNKVAGIVIGVAKGALAAIALSTALFVIGYSGISVVLDLCESSSLAKALYLGNLVKQIESAGDGVWNFSMN
jgi:uncharacterized membrane protein required for colicin V production